MSACFKAGMADFCVLQKRDGHFYFQHTLGVWPVKSRLYLPALTQKPDLDPFPYLLWACTAITQLGHAACPHHLTKRPLGQVCGQATQQHLLFNSWPQSHPYCPFLTDGCTANPLLWQAADTVIHVSTCSRHQHEPASSRAASQGQQSAFRSLYIGCKTKSTHTSSYHSSADAQEQGNDFIITYQITSLLHTQLLCVWALQPFPAQTT